MRKTIFTMATIALAALFATSATAQTAKVKTAKEGSGVDGIIVGKSTFSDVKKKFGRNYKLVKHKKYSYQLIYPGGISFYACQSDKKQQVFDIEMRAPYQVKTAKGITLSKSTLADVQRIYGKNADGGLQYRGVSFFYANVKGKKVITVIDIVENNGIRQCKEN